MTAPVVAVAWSGGRDSTALLHATLRAAKPLGVQVLALHVHHGLSPNADAWLAFCQRRAASWRRTGVLLAFAHERIQTTPDAGESVEAWARRARYAALRRLALAGGAHLVLLAHHRRDQAETFLLQALRGGGVAGLAGMPTRAERDGVCWARPWLAQPREAVEAYVRRHRLTYIDDESNEATRFARNRLRRKLWPALLEAFPHAEAALAASAEWSAQARRGLDDLACIDLATVRERGGLQVRGLLELPEHRRANVLRYWLKHTWGEVAPATLIRRLHDELGVGDGATWFLGKDQLCIHRGVLVLVSAPTDAQEAREGRLSVARAGRHRLPGWGGTLVLRRVSSGGVPLAWLGQVDLRPREGGERFQAGIGRPARSLKKQYQAAGIPSWLRDGPLLFSGGQLVFVPGLGVDARVLALPGQPQVTIAWEPMSGARRGRS